METCAISDNIPIPNRKRDIHYPFLDLEIGHSFFVHIDEDEWVAQVRRVHAAVSYFKKRYPGTQFTASAKKVHGGVRVWRTA